MIVKYNKEKHYLDLLGFVIDNTNNEFYYTENNLRKIIRDDTTLKTLLKNAHDIYVDENDGNISGIIMLWEAVGGDKKREYVKFSVYNESYLNNLLKIFSYETKGDLYIKIKKDSKYLQCFKNNGFQFKNGRGSEVLLFLNKRG